MNRLIALVLGAVLLAGCSGDPAENRDNAGELAAEGEVLGGSISDAMIPLESLRSQSPTLRAEPAVEDSPDDEAESEGDATGPEAGPAPAQAEPPIEEAEDVDA